MSLFDNDNNKRKQNQIELQNIVLNINERKLQVSEEFLDQMTKYYISRYMKIVNDNVSDMGNSASINSLLRKYSNAMTGIDNLVAIEPYYRFKRPTPTEYKAQIDENFPSFINALIAREWKKVIAANQGADLNDPAVKQKYEAFFEVYTSYDDKLPQKSKDLLKKLHDSVLAQNEEKQEEPPPLNDDNDGFVPEQFEDLSSQ